MSSQGQGLAVCIDFFSFFESCLLTSWTRFYFCADFFLLSSQCNTHSPSYNIINLNTAVQFINILSSNPEMPLTIHWYKKRVTSSTTRIYVSALLLVLMWVFDRGDLWQAELLLFYVREPRKPGAGRNVNTVDWKLWGLKEILVSLSRMLR